MEILNCKGKHFKTAVWISLHGGYKTTMVNRRFHRYRKHTNCSFFRRVLWDKALQLPEPLHSSNPLQTLQREPLPSNISLSRIAKKNEGHVSCHHLKNPLLGGHSPYRWLSIIVARSQTHPTSHASLFLLLVMPGSPTLLFSHVQEVDKEVGSSNV